MGYPANLRYTKDHEWVLLEGRIATVGITEFAQRELGDIVFVEMPEKGRAVRVGDTLGTIESVKAVSEIYAPVSGTILEGNGALADAPETVNRDPHGAGWLAKIELSDPSEAGALLDAAAYEALTGS
jgi:glycine cleavage system H protein